MSFEFLDTSVYKQSKLFHTQIKICLESQKADKYMTDQLIRASLSISLNIAEGFGRFHSAEKRSFYVTARASIYECVAGLDILYNEAIPKNLLSEAEVLGKMLSGLINHFKNKR